MTTMMGEDFVCWLVGAGWPVGVCAASADWGCAGVLANRTLVVAAAGTLPSGLLTGAASCFGATPAGSMICNGLSRMVGHKR